MICYICFGLSTGDGDAVHWLLHADGLLMRLQGLGSCAASPGEVSVKSSRFVTPAASARRMRAHRKAIGAVKKASAATRESPEAGT